MLLEGTPGAAEQLETPEWTVAQDAFQSAPDVASAIYEALSADFEGVQAVLGAPQERSLTQVLSPHCGQR